MGLTSIETGLTKGHRGSGVAMNGALFWSNGYDRPRKIIRTTAHYADIAPPGACSAAEGAAGNLAAGTYTYYVRYLLEDGGETEDGDGVDVTIAASKQVNLTSIPVSSETGVIGRIITRVDPGETARNQVTIIYDNSTTTAADNTASLSVEKSTNRGRMPAVRYLSKQNGYMFGAGDVVQHNGIVAVTNGSTAVTGSGTAWTGAERGKRFRISGSNREYVVASVASATSLTLDHNYEGTTATKQRYMITGYPSTLFHSEQNEPDHWTPGNEILVNADDGQRILGHGPWAGNVFIGKENSLWMLAGTDEDSWALRLVSDEVGLAAHDSIREIEMPGGGVWIAHLGWEGIYLTPPTGRPQLVTADIQDIIDAANVRTNYRNASGVVKPDEQVYLCTIPYGSATKQDLIIAVYYGEAEKVYVRTWERDALAMSSVHNAEGAMEVWVSDQNGRLDRMFDGWADGADQGTVRGTATSATSTTLTDTGATFDTQGDGLKNRKVHILSGTGEGQSRVISSNTATALTVSTAWTTTPDTTSVYAVGAIASYVTFKRWELGDPRVNKRWRSVVLDFEAQDNAVTMDVEQYLDGDTTAGATDEVTASEAWQRVRLNSRARALRLKLKSTDVNRPFSLRSLAVDVTGGSAK